MRHTTRSTDDGTRLPFDPIAEARRQWVSHGWQETAEGMAAVISVIRAQQILQRRLETALRPHGLTFARYEVLMLLLFSRNGSLPMSRISERLQVHPASVTNAIDRLERTGLVDRSPHPSDRRAVLAAITQRGRDLAVQATGVLNGSVFADPGLDPQDTSLLVTVLRTLRRRAGDF
jgi:DNA-binding MarR family transcriptional regulator